MKKNLTILIFIFCAPCIMNSIGVRQLKEFNDAKKEIEKIVRLSGLLSDEMYKKFEKNIAIVESVDKKVADGFRVQIARKKADLSHVEQQQSFFGVGQKESQKPKNKEGQEQESMFQEPLVNVAPEPESTKSEEHVHEQPHEQTEVIEPEAEQAQIETIQTPVASVTTSWTPPVVNSEPELREIPVTSTQSAWPVPVSKQQQEKEKSEKRAKVTKIIDQFQTAIDQAEKNLNALTINEQYVFSQQYSNFKNWNKAINSYIQVLGALKDVDNALYNQKMTKAKSVETLFAQKLVQYVLKVIELFSAQVDAQIDILQKNEDAKTSKLIIMTDKTEFNKKSYEYFFGDVSKNLWKNPNTRKNLSWFKENHQQLMTMYFNESILPFDSLLFEYHNTKNVLINDLSDKLKAKIINLQEDIRTYKKFLSNAYNGMLQVQKSLPQDGVTEQKKLIEDTTQNKNFNYEQHLFFLNEADQTIKNKFYTKLWPETAPSLI